MTIDVTSRRTFLAAATALAATPLATERATAQAAASTNVLAEVVGSEHWTIKRAEGKDVKLFLWRKRARDSSAQRLRGTILFVHGSSVSATPVFDLQIPGKPEASTMDWFARLGYDTWCVDCEGYGRSDKSRPLATIEGSVPAIQSLPAGCCFEPRCGDRIAACARELPPLIEVTPGHSARCPVIAGKLEGTSASFPF